MSSENNLVFTVDLVQFHPHTLDMELTVFGKIVQHRLVTIPFESWIGIVKNNIGATQSEVLLREVATRCQGATLKWSEQAMTTFAEHGNDPVLGLLGAIIVYGPNEDEANHDMWKFGILFFIRIRAEMRLIEKHWTIRKAVLASVNYMDALGPVCEEHIGTLADVAERMMGGDALIAEERMQLRHRLDQAIDLALRTCWKEILARDPNMSSKKIQGEEHE